MPRDARRTSRLQQRASPAPPPAHEELPVVEPMLAVRPEVDRIRDDPEPGPGRWPRDGPPPVLPSQAPPARDQPRAAGKLRALWGDARRQPTRPRARLPVGVGLARGDGRDPSLDADLPAERVLVEREGRPRVPRQLPSLAAARVGEEDEPAPIRLLQQ